jgi:UDP-N-acetyl-D-mannosaminuronate dehydrogenase
MAGKTPVVEEGMVDLMALAAASGRVAVTTDAQRAVLDSEISLVCVGTPSAANGSQDQGAILRLAEEMGSAIAGKSTPHIVVFRSTLVPGTVEDVLRPIIEAKSGKKDGEGFSSASSRSFCAKARRSAITTSRPLPSSVPIILSGRAPARLFGNLPAASSKPRSVRPR